MARPPISDEEILLKKRARQRLIGATALVLALVIFLPMLLEEKPKPVGQDIAITLPPPPDTEFFPKVTPAAPSEDRPTPAVTPMPDALPSAPSELKKPQPAISENTAYLVQLGVFSNSANAEKLQATVALQGITSETETINSPQGTKTRVRAGPYSSKDEAQSIQAKLKTAGINSVVVTEKQ